MNERTAMRLRDQAPVISLVLALAGCGDGSSDADGGSPTADAGVGIDAGASDAGALDAAAVDAGGEDAGFTGADPTGDGPFTVSTQAGSVERDGRTTPVTAHVPDGAGPSPLVLFLPGFQLGSERYAPLCDRLASHGYVVVRADPPASLLAVSHVAMRDDAIAVLDWAATELPVSGAVGLMGHSLGGKVTTMVAGMRAGVGALLGIDPVNGGNPFSGYSATLPDIVPEVTATLTMAVGYLGETTNASGGVGGMACAPADQNYATFYDGSTMSPWAAEWTFEGADHMDFVSDTAGCGFTCSACTDGTADAATVQASTATLMVAFFERHLRGRGDVDAYLTGAMVPSGVTTRSRP